MKSEYDYHIVERESKRFARFAVFVFTSSSRTMILHTLIAAHFISQQGL